MIILAREARGITQLELSEKIGMSRTNIGKMENGDIGVKEDILTAIADATSYPISFFRQDEEVFPEPLAIRKRDSVAQGILTPINAKTNIIRFHLQYLLKALDITAPILPIQQVDEAHSPLEIATALRDKWKIKSPVIDNITALLESKGIAIGSFDFGTERVDSKCVLTKEKYPLLIANRTLLGDRQRFSLSYQLGHLLMHMPYKLTHDRDISHEANLFAAEFLMPENDIRSDFENGITVPLLADLKLKWKVSMISLLYRADDLGYLTPNQKRYLLQQFNEQKLRRREPTELDITIEKPVLVRKWIAEVKSKLKLDTKGMAGFLHLNTDEFIEIYG
ncbi:MAG: ImmA/IrrE family metallo-endopeptidase [Bacteroidetes bacterium]|nr:ImmA/IrrE family metallo-endopeptidase [Bacteroidota bacterium]